MIQSVPPHLEFQGEVPMGHVTLEKERLAQWLHDCVRNPCMGHHLPCELENNTEKRSCRITHLRQHIFQTPIILQTNFHCRE